MFWFILQFALQLVLGAFFKPKTVSSGRPATLKEFSAPQIEPTRKIPIIFGKVKLDSAQCGWYGDFQHQRMTKKVKDSPFSSTLATLCFRYYVGLSLFFCHGVVDELSEIWSEDKQIWTGSVTGGDFTLNNVTAFGGDREEDIDKRSEGGMFAKCTFYSGSSTQSRDTYLSSILGTDIPAWRGVSHLVFQGPSSGYTFNQAQSTYNLIEPYYSGYVGLNPQVKPLSFVLTRIPKYISSSYWNINSGDANPADVIYEALINDVWGMAYSSSLIDSASFLSAAQTLHTEGLGFSAIWEKTNTVKEFIEEVLAYIDGTLYTDPITGLFTLKLAREDYVISSLLEVNDSNKVEIVNLTRGAIDESVNEVKVSYIDRFNKFKESTQLSQENASYRTQGKRNSTTTSYIGISNAETAGKIAQRDLRTLSTSLIKCTLKVDRSFAELRPASVFKLTWSKRSLSQVIMRVVSINLGEYSSGQIEIEAIQDIFSLAATTYTTQTGNLWTSPVGSATTITSFETIESPYYYSDINHQIKVFAKKPDSNQFSYNTYVSQNGISGNYYAADLGDGFTPVGSLTASYGNTTNDVDTGSITFSSPSSNLLLLQNFNSESISQGYNLFYMNGEIMAFETVIQNIDGSVTLSNIWRGLFDTTPQEHASGSTAWFFSYANAAPSTYFSAGNTIYTKLESVASTTRAALSTADSLVIVRRSLKPLPPANFRINSSTSSTTIASGNIVIDWTHRNREIDGKRILKQFTNGTTIEPRTEYIIKFLKSDGSTLRTVTGLTGTTYTYTSADQIIDNSGSEPSALTIQLYSKREGLYSLMCQYRKIIRSGGTMPATPSYSPGTDTYTPISSADATSISGTPVANTNSANNNDVLTYNSSTQTWIPQPISALSIGTINSQTKSVNGAVIASNQLIMQTADTASVGLVSTSDQTFAGNKTFNGKVILNKASYSVPVNLTDASTIAVDASVGTRFRCTSSVDRILGAPTNPADGQTIMISWKNTDTNSHILTLTTGAGGYRLGSDISTITSTASGKTDKLTFEYNASDNRWDLIGYTKGY